MDAAEIERRLVLLRTKRNDLENDFWTRTFTEEKRQPKLLDHNAFLASVVEGRKPGTALDVGMGNGRNSIYRGTSLSTPLCRCAVCPKP